MIKFRVSADGHDEFNVTAGPRDILAWEARFPGASYVNGLLVERRLTEVYQLAYVTLQRSKHPLVTPGMSVGQFMELADIQLGHKEEADELDQSDPTQPEA